MQSTVQQNTVQNTVQGALQDVRSLYQRAGRVSMSLPVSSQVKMTAAVSGDPWGVLGTGRDDGSVMLTATFTW